MSLIGLDLNASRARAVAGPRSQALSLLCLDGDQVELPLALSLEEKHPLVGRPAYPRHESSLSGCSGGTKGNYRRLAFLH